MIETLIYSELTNLYLLAPTIRIKPEERWVIFSDLHLGNGGSRDDFLKNSRLFQTVLQNYYQKNHYHLVLNGDVEELQRFPPHKIGARWKTIYDLFGEFQRCNTFYQIVGNHDHDLLHHPDTRNPLYPALKLSYHGNILFIFHGHQASFFLERFNALCGFILRYLANPIGIKNFAIHQDSTIRFKTEKRVYSFSRQHKIVSLIGHTHRPLFESLSKIDSLKFKIEQLCRDYPLTAPESRPALAQRIQTYHQELQYYLRQHSNTANRSSLYNSDLLVPCLFNSGCVIGKNGITALEINDGRIALVYWFDARKSRKYFNSNGYQPQQLDATDYYRVVINQDELDYIFTRIKMLA